MLILFKKLLAEFAGTLMLLCVVIGSGIMAQQLSQGHDAIALLANTLATLLGLYVLIDVLGPVSGAHFNPLVTTVMVLMRRQPAREYVPYVLAQLAGAVLGACLANLMFDLPMLELSHKLRGGMGQWVGELVASAGLLLVILLGQPQKIAALVASYIGAAYWFTSSTSFANPAAVVGRMFSDSFAGIAPASATGFIMAQLAGGIVVYALFTMARRLGGIRLAGDAPKL